MSKFAVYGPNETVGPPLDASNGLVIRPAQQSDLLALTAIASEREGTTPAAQADALGKFLQRCVEFGRSIVLVADVGGIVVGFGKCVYFTPPPAASANTATEGWYLMGVVIAPDYRRRGVGRELTCARLEWIAQRASKAYYFVNAQNRVSIALHQQFSFVEVTREFSVPDVTFDGGNGILFEVDLACEAKSSQALRALPGLQ